MATPSIEMTNSLSHPDGPEYQLSVGEAVEGVYTLQDSLHLATPPPHPQEAPATSSNPLATTPGPPRAGVKISVCVINPRRTPPPFYRAGTAGSTVSTLGTYSLKEHEKESRSSNESNSDGKPPHKATNNRASVYVEEGNQLLTPALGKEGLKRKKPKTNLVKSNSQFISRVIPHDQLQKRLQEHSPEGLFLFANIDRAYQWLDLSSPTPARAQPLMKILFAKANILCHDINHFTKTTNHIDVVMGANTGDIVWFEAYSQKYVRINKGNIISSSPITEIRWLPGSENLFLASHMDGTLIVYDKEREDAAFTPETPNGLSTPENGVLHTSANGDLNSNPPLHINKSITSKNQKSNPVASWRLFHYRITAFAFSPNPSSCPYLAVVSEDGSLRIINYLKETLTDLYPSYYGAFTCVCWSPDGKYVLTGGQDDLVTLWSLHERRIVARCQGHRSWVTAVAFDPWRSCDGRNYRFGSVGEDRRLLLWDFNVGMLRRPKGGKSGAQRNAANRGSVSSYPAPGRASQATSRLRSDSSLLVDGEGLDGEGGCIEHEVESRTVTAELPPVMSKVVDEDRMSWLGFEEEFIITACADGHIRAWTRPSDVVNSSQVALS
ncbi:uncharacterized protein KY384_002661 [Bacidia gigantensis]|uniref:uncharacterized protein n=1 Tax=Bacidia gigantensis TaxID=2732470 RepID=UPI001D04C3EE|nr:uncharacterized protein KY384_002661 [Bacidia gigantensis]KAG8532783.1 hypothetical protein KY384_002661 [Bacidia gigantensis]